MTDNELLALTSMLDDADMEIKTELRKQLLSKGLESVLRLEWACSQYPDSPEIQAELGSLIAQLQAENTQRKLYKWRLGGAKDLLEVWFILTQNRFPSLQLEHFQNQVKRLVSLIWLEMREESAYSARVLAINKVLYQREGYKGMAVSSRAASHFYLNDFFAHKQGNAYSLGFLYLIIARQLELPISPILLPNYFALNYEDHKYNFYIDPYNQGGIFYKADLEEFIQNSQLPQNADYFLPISNRNIVLAFVYELLKVYQDSGIEEDVAVLRRFVNTLNKF